MKSVFKRTIVDELQSRIDKLNATSVPNWGKMNIAQMLAHCNVTYEMAYENKHPRPSGFKRWILKMFVKNIVVSEKQYAKNGRTAPEFLIVTEKDFQNEKSRLTAFIYKTQQLGENHFESKESHSFGKLTSSEWNNMFYKHLDHHLTQFGV